MKLVPPLALFAGGVLTALALVSALVVWIQASHDRQLLLPQPPPSSFATSVEQSTSLEGVKRACAAVAQSYDIQNQVIRGLGGHIDALTKVILWGLMGVGFIVGPLFLFIYVAVRKHVPKAN